MLSITFKNQETKVYNKNEYTEYKMVRNYSLFIVMNMDQWIGIYNMDDISKIEYLEYEGLYECLTNI